MSPVSDLMMTTLPQAQLSSAAVLTITLHQWEYLSPTANIWQDVHKDSTGTVFAANTENTWLRRNVGLNADHPEDVTQKKTYNVAGGKYPIHFKYNAHSLHTKRYFDPQFPRPTQS